MIAKQTESTGYLFALEQKDGQGNFGHAGIPGHVGGSKPGKVSRKPRTDFRNMTREDAAELLGSSHGMPKARWERLWQISQHGPRRAFTGVPKLVKEPRQQQE
jgi:hypothetical protein